MIKKRIVGLITILTAAAASVYALTQGDLGAGVPAPSNNTPIVAVASTSQPCAYTWAYHNLPEISAEFQSAVRAILPEAEARASAFGEDCINADGRAVSFSAMETDFYVFVSVADLNDNEALGDLIARIFPLMEKFPISRVSGPKAGFLELTFRNGDDQRVFRIPLPRGRELRERGLRGAALIAAIEQE